MFKPSSRLSNADIEGRLFFLAVVFLGLYSITLSLSAAARARSWQVAFPWEHWLAFLVWVILFAIAHRQSNRYTPGRDPYILPVAALLSGWGLMTIWRLFPSFGIRQTIWLAISVLAFTAGLRLPARLSFLRKYKYLWLTSGLALTGLTLILGTYPASGSGPRLWLGCCGVYFQPSEPLKLLLIIYLASYLADRQPILALGPASDGAQNPGGSTALLPLLAPTLIMTGLALLLLLVQRDLGTATIFLFLFGVIVYLATRRFFVLATSALVLAISGAAGYFLFDVVRIRVDAWLNPWLDPSGGSYQIVQSLLAIANGGVFGRGPGLGNPAFVPIPHSDFIFSAIVEESGLLGAIALITLLAILAARSIQIAIRAADRYRRYLAAGLAAYLIGQSILIISGNLRLLPLTGVTLPFVSYGGSSLLTSFLSALILTQISTQPDSGPTPATVYRPYLLLGGFLFTGLAATAIATSWWTYYRGPSLITRTDNPRRALTDRQVRRGALLDRHNEPIAVTAGKPSEFTRQVDYPPLSPITGYTDPIYGQAGLEASLDPFLRGLRGRPGLEIWWNHLLYGQPPPGLDVRLSLDLDLQKTADELLQDRASSLVLLNARSGEILAMSSHPFFNPNELEENLPGLMNDPRAPLFNRATLGQYPPGTALGPLLLTAATAQAEVPPLPGNLDFQLDGATIPCATTPTEFTWEGTTASGCPGPQSALGSALGPQAVLDLYKDAGLYSAPDLRLPASSSLLPSTFQQPQRAYLGESELGVSPLQVALAAATLSNGGILPAPQIAVAVNTAPDQWTVLPPLGESRQVLPKDAASAVAESMAVDGLPIWQSTGRALNGASTVTWYQAGTLPTWNGAPLALVVLLEEDNPELAIVIGQAMVQAALQSP